MMRMMMITRRMRSRRESVVEEHLGVHHDHHHHNHSHIAELLLQRIPKLMPQTKTRMMLMTIHRWKSRKRRSAGRKQGGRRKS